MIREIIWDWNGTLLDDTQACVNAINAMLEKRSLASIDHATYRAVFGFPVINFYRHLHFDIDHEDWDALSQEFHALFLEDKTIRLHPDTPTILNDLRARGIAQSILSASEQMILETMLRHYEIQAYFAHVCGVDNLHGRSKIETGHALIKQIAHPREEVLLVGDTLHDAEVAEALGIACILVAHGHQAKKRLETTRWPVLNTLAELPLALSAHL